MDAKNQGSLARLINHSCDPNLFIQPVCVGHTDFRFPRLCLFAMDNIPAGVELTWDYAMNNSERYGYALDMHACTTSLHIDAYLTQWCHLVCIASEEKTVTLDAVAELQIARATCLVYDGLLHP